jgi:hypothetical protein
MPKARPLKDEVSRFLKEFKILAQSDFDFIERREFNKSASAIGLTRDDCFDLIMQLQTNDYEGGPKEDRDRPNEYLWEFGMTLDGIEIYIKLKVVNIQMRNGSSKKFARCFAFHRASFPLKRPFLRKGG